MSRPTNALNRAKPVRHRIGRVTYFHHHGSWYVYHRHGGRAVRCRVVGGEARAEYEASLLNARLVAAEANLVLSAVASVVATTDPRMHQAVAQGVSPAASPPVAPPVSLAQLRRQFLRHHEHVLESSLATVNRYRSATLYLERLAEQQGWAANAIDVASFVEHLRRIEIAPNGHANTSKRRLRDKGIRYVLETCRAMYHFGQRHNVLPSGLENPFTRFGLAHLKNRDAKDVFVFSADDELRFLEAGTAWSFPLQFILAKTGLRPGEAAHLLIDDLDLQEGWLSVQGKPELGWAVKTGHDRRVPLIPQAVAALRQAIGTRKAGPVFVRPRYDPAAEASIAGGRSDMAAAVAARVATARQKNGRPPTRTEEATIARSVWRDAGGLDADRIRTSFIQIARRIGLSASCPKSWRHTFATLLQQANVDLLVRQETLGHKPTSPQASALGMTGTYTHTTPEFQRSEIERALRLRPRTLELVQRFLTTQGRESEV